MNLWKHRMIDGYSRAVSVDDFFSSYMAGERTPTPAQITEIVKNVVNQENMIELKMYPTFVKYAQKISEHLPSSTKPAFENTSGITFKRLHPTDHDSRPDVSSPLPGVEPPKVWEWHHVGTVIEFKVKDDPFDAQGGIKSGQLENLVQLLKNARCILMASGNRYVFVVSVFRNNARLFRVDRSGYIVSDPFNWSTNDRIFPEFYWRLYNGAKGDGSWATTPPFPLPPKTKRSHGAESLGQGYFQWERYEGFTVGAPIFQSKGLFGRGTRVERVLIEGEDRIPTLQRYTDYAEARAEDNLGGKMNGLATCLGSIDLSKLHPEHKTITAALRAGGDALLDRHQFALMAGVLHRDISAGNVLISEDGPGFLLDFDYSEFTEDGLARFKSLHPDFDLEEIDKDMKDITLLLALVWLLLRHVEHDDPQVFRAEVQAGWPIWVLGGPRLPIRNNPPLTALVDALNTMFRTQNTDQNTPATHESLLAAFDKAIGSAGWPENDTAKEFVLPFVSLGMPPPYMPDAMSNAGSQVGSGSTSFWRQRAKAAVVVPRSEQEVEGPGSAGASGSSGVKRKRNEGEEGSVQGRRRSTRTKTIKH
ncbi:hypothetical protein B0H13DRAFT_2031202 [Mycena leptocephala]|nr:hypothetical protein B0H13DRAFT_2031202 [Mycena leptocephala]